MKERRKGWHHPDYDFEDFYDGYWNVTITYEGKDYYISCEGDQSIYDADTNEVLKTFNSKEEFYTMKFLGLTMKELFDNSYVGPIG